VLELAFGLRFADASDLMGEVEAAASAGGREPGGAGSNGAHAHAHAHADGETCTQDHGHSRAAPAPAASRPEPAHEVRAYSRWLMSSVTFAMSVLKGC
jgi:hypothetical protein